MDKHFWIQILENCNVGLAGIHLDMLFYVPDGLTEVQCKALERGIRDAITEYGENHSDYSEMDYRKILETAAGKLYKSQLKSAHTALLISKAFSAFGAACIRCFNLRFVLSIKYEFPKADYIIYA